MKAHKVTATNQIPMCVLIVLCYPRHLDLRSRSNETGIRGHYDIVSNYNLINNNEIVSITITYF
jgi:hypothetical protein